MSDHPIVGVYRITNTATGRVYVGFGMDVLLRMTQHIRTLGIGKHFSKPLQTDWDAYGAGAFSFELIEEIGGDVHEQEAAEERWIAAAMSSPHGAYNRRRSCKSRTQVVVNRQAWRGRALEHLEAELKRERARKPKRRSAARTGEGE